VAGTAVTVLALAAVIIGTRGGEDPEERMAAGVEAPRVLRAIPLDDPGAEVALDLTLADDEVVDAVGLGRWVLADVSAAEGVDRLVVLDPATGDRVAEWAVPPGGFAHVEDGVAWDGLFVVPIQGPDARDQVVAIAVGTGEVAWTTVVEGEVLAVPDRLTTVEQVLVVDDDTLALVETVAEGTQPGTPRQPRVRFLDREGMATAVSPALDATTAPAGSVVVDGEVVVVVRDRAVPVSPDGSLGAPVALPVCALAVGPADGDLLLAGAVGTDCSRDRHDLDAEHVVRVGWPSGAAAWDVVVDTTDRPEPTPVLLPSPAGAVVALTDTAPGGHYVSSAIDATDGTVLWDDPEDALVVGPGGHAFGLDSRSAPFRFVLAPADVRTGETVAAAPVDTGSGHLVAGVTATHVISA
jgi:hypothetical protein